MTGDTDIGYLPAMVYREVAAGRKCEITGSICKNISTMDEYTKFLPQLRGKFGETIPSSTTGIASFATRVIPEWAIEAMEVSILTCPEMRRWLE